MSTGTIVAIEGTIAVSAVLARTVFVMVGSLFESATGGSATSD